MKKPEIKINFLHYGTPFDLHKNFFVCLLKRKYRVIISDKPDYVFFSVYKENNQYLDKKGIPGGKLKKQKTNYGSIIKSKLLGKSLVRELLWSLREKGILKPYAKIPEIKGNFVKIFYTTETIKPEMSKCDWAFGPFYESEINHPNYLRVPPYVISEKNFDLRKGERSIEKIKKEKELFCNFIYSNPIFFRNNFFKKLSKYKKIDSPGKCMNNMPPIGSHKDSKDSRAAKNFMREKRRFISKYKFTIGFENKSHSGYITEKLIDPMLANSIPIYFGPKDVHREFNTKSFINFHDFKNMDEFITHIIKVDQDDELYKKMLEEPWLNQNKPSIWMDEKRILQKFKEIFG